MRQRHKRRDHTASDFTCERLEDRVLLSTVRFSSGPSIPISQPPLIVDLDGDGDLDLLGVSIDSQSELLRAAMNDGQAGFAQTVDQVIPQIKRVLAAFDFDGDGKVDALIATDSSLAIMFGNGDGSFQAPQVIPGSSSATRAFVGQFNNDALTDVAVSDGQRVTFLHGDGATLVLAFSFQLPTGFDVIAERDQNGDGLLDLITNDPVTGGVQVWFTGQSTVTPGPFSSVGNDVGILVGDLNKDGVADLIASNAIWLGSQAGQFLRDDILTLQLRSFVGSNSFFNKQVLADLDGDGNLDLLVIIGGRFPTSRFLLGNGDGSFRHKKSWTYNVFVSFGGTADFNGDGIRDLVISSGGPFGSPHGIAIARSAGWVPASESIEVDTPRLVPGRPALIRVSGIEVGLGRSVSSVVIERKIVGVSRTPDEKSILSLHPDPNDPSVWVFDGMLPDNAGFGQFPLRAIVMDDLDERSPGQFSPTVLRRLWSRVYTTDGFYSPRRVTERLDIIADKLPADYQVLIHYSGGRTELVAQGSLAPGQSKKLFISRRGRPGIALVDPRRAYSIEVISTEEVGATFRRTENFGTTPADAAKTTASLTDLSSTTFGFADIATTGLDFLAFFNPFKQATTVTTTFYDNGQVVASVDRTLGALRRGGLNITSIAGLDPDRSYSAIVTAADPISASLTRWTRTASGFTALGDTSQGRSMTRIDLSSDVVSILTLFNPNPTPIVVDLTTSFDDPTASPIVSSVTLQGFERREIDAAPGSTASSGATVQIQAPQAVYAMSHTASTTRGDSIASAPVSVTAVNWVFAGGTYRRGESLDRLILFNAGIDIETYDLVISFRGVSSTRRLRIESGQTLSLDLSLEPALFNPPFDIGTYSVRLDHVPKNFSQQFVNIAATLEHWDPVSGKAWSMDGTPFGRLLPM